MEYWFLFPVGIVIAACATSSAIAGSNFWTPVYLMWMGLEPKVSFWASLATMLFGFGSGVYRNLRDGTFDKYLIGRYLLIAGPMTAVGALASARLEAAWLLHVFALFVFGYGAYLIREFLRPGSASAGRAPDERVHMGVGAVAGFLHGAIASGVGVLLMPAILGHKRIRHHAAAVGSTVILVFTCSLISIAFRVDGALLASLVEHSGEIAAMIAFAAPGVMLGGQLGPRLTGRLPRRLLRLWIGGLLIVVGVLVGYQAFGSP